MSTSEDTNPEFVKGLIDSALNAALVVIHFNGVTAMADKAFKNIINRTDIKKVNIIWRLDSVMVSYKLNGNSELIMKPVLSIGTSLNGLYKTMELTEDVKNGKVEISDVNSELKKIIALPLIHKRWVYILLDGLAAAFYLKFHHGTFETIMIVLAAAMIGETVRYKLQSMAVPGNRIMFISGIVSAGIASLVLHNGYGTVEITTLIASVIYLVPGLRMINGFIDLISLNYIFIGMQRIVNALYLLLILAVVIMIAFTFTNF
ncbi:MAG TPA: threonine/serine exporter family protein [Ignavibacteria bacterium]|nr:threonine/serine exporter family protein [Ignavibacteria bacterium]